MYILNMEVQTLPNCCGKPHWRREAWLRPYIITSCVNCELSVNLTQADLMDLISFIPDHPRFRLPLLPPAPVQTTFPSRLQLVRCSYSQQVRRYSVEYLRTVLYSCSCLISRPPASNPADSPANHVHWSKVPAYRCDQAAGAPFKEDPIPFQLHRRFQHLNLPKIGFVVGVDKQDKSDLFYLAHQQSLPRQRYKVPGCRVLLIPYHPIDGNSCIVWSIALSLLTSMYCTTIVRWQGTDKG